jgi:hypothetical protein
MDYIKGGMRMYTVIDLIETGGPLGTETITKETNIGEDIMILEKFTKRNI